MNSPRQDKETVGLGASMIVAVVGVIVAGVGLVSMRTAFQPLPKTDTPVVLTRPAHALIGAADPAPAPTPAALVRAEEPSEDTVEAAPLRKARARAELTRAPAVERPEISRDAPQADLQPVAAPAAAPQKLASIANADDGKLCKAPSPNVVTAKALQPGLILRYDPKFRANPIDIPPPSPPPEEERRLKLSALLADILNN